MALMEAESGDAQGAFNVLGAIYNRAEADGMPLERSVSGRIYQPTIEDNQRARLPQIVKHPAFQQMTAIAEKRGKGEVGDWVQGATHFLAPEKTMLALEAREPQKYRSWRQWTGFDPETSSYAGVIMRDGSHAFLRPGGAGQAQPTPMAQSQPPQTAEAKPMFDLMALAKLFKMGTPASPAAGSAAAAGRTLPSAANPGTDMQNLFGSLGNFAPGGQDGSTAQGQGQQQMSQADSSLAAQAMQSAQGGPSSGGMQMQPRPVDMTKLSQILQNAGRLGVYRPQRSA